jgi:hypothetical protein
MKQQRHFDTAEAAQHEAVKIRKMIVDFDRYVQLLDCDITTEEQRAGTSDPSASAYPVLANAGSLPRKSYGHYCRAGTTTFSAGC